MRRDNSAAFVVALVMLSGCALPITIGGRQYESQAVLRKQTNLPPHMTWIGKGTATAGVIPAETKSSHWTSTFMEADKLFSLPGNLSWQNLRLGPALSLEETRGSSDVYHFNIDTVGVGGSIVTERYGMLTGRQTKVRLLYGFRNDWGMSKVGPYRADEYTNQWRISWDEILYRSERFFRLLNKVEGYVRCDVDADSSKRSSNVGDVDPGPKVKLARQRIVSQFDPATNNTSTTVGVVVNAIRFGTGVRDVTLRTGVEWADEREFQARSVRFMFGPSFWGEHVTVLFWKKVVYEDGGKDDAPDSKGVSVWATVWSW